MSWANAGNSRAGPSPPSTRWIHTPASLSPVSCVLHPHPPRLSYCLHPHPPFFFLSLSLARCVFPGVRDPTRTVLATRECRCRPRARSPRFDDPHLIVHASLCRPTRINHRLEDTVEGPKLSKFLCRPSRTTISVSTILGNTLSQRILYTLINICPPVEFPTQLPLRQIFDF